jgi:hypothetical protein
MNRMLLSLVLVTTLACSDELANPVISSDEVVVVVNSTDNSLTLVPVNDPTATATIPLGTGTATPVSLAVRGSIAAVPLGLDHAVALVDLNARVVARTVALAQGSGATGAAFEGDSAVWVANPLLNTVTRVTIVSGDTASVGVGQYPQALAAIGDELWVLNVNLVSFAPVGPGWLSVVDLTNATVVDSVGLTGENSQFLVPAEDGLLYVVHSGRFGGADGRLSVVDPDARRELAVVNGLGEFPGASADDLRRARVLVTSFAHGLMEVDRATRTLTRGPDDGILVDGAGFAGIALDSSGRLYAIQSGDCVAPGAIQILQADFSRVRTVAAGSCPFAVAATRLEP